MTGLLVAGVTLAGSVVAQEAVSGEVVKTIIQYGISPTVIVIMGVLGMIEYKPAVNRLVQTNERQHHQIEGLVQTYEERVIPLLTQVNEVLARQAEEERRRRERREWEQGT